VSKSSDVVCKYSTSVKLKKPSCEIILYGCEEKEGKWVENPCPIWVVERAWWLKHHEEKDREQDYLRNNNVLVRSMAVNHSKTRVGLGIQHVTSKMVSPSMAGRSVYRLASPHGQLGPTYHCCDGPSGSNGRVKCAGHIKSVSHTWFNVGSVGLTSGSVNHTLGVNSEERGLASKYNFVLTTEIKSSVKCVGLISKSVNHTNWKILWVSLTSETSKKYSLGANLVKQSWDRKFNFCGTARVKEKPSITKNTNLWEKGISENSSAIARRLCRWQKILPPRVGKF
jgi:hypothetical protein